LRDTVGKAQQVSCRIRIDGLRRLGFQQNELPTPGRHDEVNFESALVAKKIELSSTPKIDLLFDDLCGDEALEDRSKERRARQLALRFDAQEVTGQS
jgi:hypothetical protein